MQVCKCHESILALGWGGTNLNSLNCELVVDTLPATNMAPDKGSLKQETDLPGTLPRMLC